MSITTPAQLVAEYKKSGEFDRLRREILSDFQRSEAVRPLLSRVEDIARQKLQADRKLEYLPQEAVHRELMTELDSQTRYPVVERAVGEFRAKSERLYPAEVRASLKSFVRDTLRRERTSEPARRVEEPTRPPVKVAASIVPPAPTEVHTKGRDVEDVRVEDAKRNEDEDAMDVEQTSAQPLPNATAKHANEHPPDQPTLVPTDGREVEKVPHAH